ncbi:MAG: SDR family oxidoreductase [Ignavibacteriota bacterium]|nr:MAG: SDR family oxidoreductase [Chlorobiota bacterium]MBE7475298.1 SDR family oxidoreductase [Ignavibacteriales bacterium]MBL1122265.1 SDR family oxidoreductase [Ignavibacteriota bacterium]MCE7855420.1 SDR family oxidoreductase [Ignavibacteria bacterium CHB3]MCZ7615910.1 SDR family oxidoreductase [Ignavibacteriaceae bacterium]MEB2297715.1 SDR family oxidoreductase [Ignavibacteria bacterium]
MQDKICLITGATSGIGKAAALKLADTGASLILLSRNEKKGEKICNQIKEKNNTQVKFYKADISSMKQVRNVSEKIKSDFNHIDVLINNAGARFDNYFKNDEGIELTFATNHLGHFLLTLSLIEMLKKSSQGRVINISSAAHANGTEELYDIVAPEHYDRRLAYGRSKLANLYFTYELASRLQSSKITVNAVDPGGVATNFSRNNGLIPWMKHYLSYILNLKLISPQKASETVVYLASSDEVGRISGKYFFEKKEINSSSASYSKETAMKLWQLSLKLTGTESLQF